ncbi:hypothetical protein LCGC14_2991510 [marine sediment metagenome]|uniref:Uncharacterized protein n=1 Tax=marine sediment metagenome TaxID=412755 RepID=A0A0F8XR89_9ZZZZ
MDYREKIASEIAVAWMQVKWQGQYNLADQILNIPAVERVCPECKGEGTGQFYFNQNAPCDVCKGTGKVSFTIREAVKE